MDELSLREALKCVDIKEFGRQLKARFSSEGVNPAETSQAMVDCANVCPDIRKFVILAGDTAEDGEMSQAWVAMGATAILMLLIGMLKVYELENPADIKPNDRR